MMRLRTLAMSACLCLGFSLPALAHAHLKASAPAADATVAAPAELRLTFSEGLEPAFSGVSVAGPNGAAVATGKAALAPGDDKVLVVPVSGRLPAGSYEVKWHALSNDGHRTQGSYRFTVRP